MLARRAEDPGSEARLRRRQLSCGLRGLDQARRVRPPERAAARAPSHERVCGVAPVEAEQTARIFRRIPAHVRDASERSRLHLEVRVTARPRETLADLFVSRGPVYRTELPESFPPSTALSTVLTV